MIRERASTLRCTYIACIVIFNRYGVPIMRLVWAGIA